MISIIIPTVNQVELMTRCLHSLYDSSPTNTYSYEVIVVDDGSPAEIQGKLREALRSFPVRLLTHTNNAGFAVTVNRGVAASKGKYICLLNNDVTLIQKNWLDIMMKDTHRVRAGVIGPRLLYPDGTIQHGGIIYIPETHGFDHEYRHQPGNYPPAQKTREVLGVTGALMLINRELWDSLGGMDERFFIGMEDIDFSLRTWEQGWRIYFSGMAVAVHPEGFTRGNDPYWRSKGLESGHRFAEKWHRKLAALRRMLHPVDGQGRPISISEAQAIQWRKIVSRGNSLPVATKGTYTTYRSDATNSKYSPPVYRSR